MLRAICQRCREPKHHWTIRQAEIHIGELQNWKLQLCELCTVQAQMIIHEALKPLSPLAGEAQGSNVVPTSPDAETKERDLDPIFGFSDIESPAGGAEHREACQLNRAKSWCLTHSCYPRTCAKLSPPVADDARAREEM